jgi:hypothetical protein
LSCELYRVLFGQVWGKSIVLKIHKSLLKLFNEKFYTDLTIESFANPRFLIARLVEGAGNFIHPKCHY